MANKKIAGITVEIDGDTSKLGKALDTVETKGRNLRGELREINSALKLDPTNTELLAQKQEVLAEAIKNTKDKLTTLRDAQGQIEEKFKAGEIDDGQYRAFKREIENAESQLDSLETQLKETTDKTDTNTDATKEMGDEYETAGDKAEKTGEKSCHAGELAVAGIAAAAGAAKKIYDAWSEVDEGYDTIITKTGATGDALKDLQTVADNIFKTMPVDMATVGTAVGEVNTRFGSTGDELQTLSEQFLKFSAINGVDVNSSIDDVSAAIKAFGMSGEDAAGLLDVLTTVGQQTGLDMNTLQGRLAENAATFKEMGLSASESAQLLGQFEINGVDVSAAMTSLAKAQQNATANGQSLSDALGDSIGKIKNAGTETEALTIATDLFGKKGAAQMAQAIREGRIDITAMTDDITAFSGATTDTFEATQSAPDKMKVAFNNLKSEAAEVGETLLRELIPIINRITDSIKRALPYVQNIIKFVIDNKQSVVTAISAIAGAIMGMELGKLITTISTLNITLAANPIGAVATAVGALAGVVIYLYNTCEPFKEFIDNFFDDFKIGAEMIVDNIVGIVDKVVWAVEDIIDWFINLKDNWLAGMDIIKNGFINAWQAIKDAFKSVGSFFGDVWSNITAAFSDVSGFFGRVFSKGWTAVKNVFTNVGDFFGGIWDKITERFSEVGTKVAEAIGGAFKTAINAVIGVVEGAINTIPSAINGAIDAINELPGVKIGKMSKVELPRLAKGGTLAQGSAIVAEAGPELISMLNGKVQVTPLTTQARNEALSSAGSSDVTNVYQTFNVYATINNDMDVRNLSQKLGKLSKQTAFGKGV